MNLLPYITREGTKSTLKMPCDLTAVTAPELRPELKNVIIDGVRDLVLDMTQVHVVDSAGIGLLVAVYNSLARLNGTLSVVNLSGELLKLFKAFRLDRHFSISGTGEEEA